MCKIYVECTVGVVRTTGGLLFFKNRDLSQAYIKYQLSVFHSTPEFYALGGVNLKTKMPEGVSIGVNRHRVCVANTHVVATDDTTYDVLCHKLLEHIRDKKDVPQFVADFMQRETLQGGRILIAAPEWGYLVEVLKRNFAIEALEGNFVITNSFTLLPQPAKQSPVREKSSITRLETAQQIIQLANHIGAIKAMLRSHLPEKGEFSICNHRQDGGGSESSHIIQIQGDYVGWSALAGYPCENDYSARQLFQT